MTALSDSTGAAETRPFASSKFAIALILLLLAVLVFAEPLTNLVERWGNQEEYSHGFLIPLVSACLLWLRREALRASCGAPSWHGPAAIALALAMHIVGQLSATPILSQTGFVVVLFGIVLCVGGYSLFKVAAFPIGFLLFGVPLPHFADAALTLRLQHISSQLGVYFVGLLGIPVYLDGNIVDMGNYRLQVVEACSGLRYLYPLLSLSFLAAYLFQAPIWQRTLVFLSSIPIAIGMNGLRIGLVGYLVDRFGTGAAEGALHLFEGWVVFLACGMLLALEICAFATLAGKAWSSVFYVPEIRPQKPRASAVAGLRQAPFLAAVVLISAGGLAALAISSRPEALPLRTRFAEFPDQLGAWQGHPSLLDLETERVLNLDDYILSDYRRSRGESVNLYVAYYATHTPHSPSECVPAGGWDITDDREISYDSSEGKQRLNRVVIEKGDVKQLVYYWFDEHGRKFANQYWAKFYRIVDGIFENRSDGALVRVVTRINSDEPVTIADKRLQSFMADLQPRLRDFLPASGAPADRAAFTPLSYDSPGK